MEQSVQRSDAELKSVAAIMVYVDRDADTDNRINLAAALARQFGAALIGVAGWPLRGNDALSDLDFPPAEDGRRQKVAEQLEGLGKRFRQAAGDSPPGVEWRSSVHFPREFIVEQAHTADLVVIGRDALPGDVYRTYDPGTVILASGRPILVVPPGISRMQAARPMIAWKNTREARRAIRDALPLLKNAESVCIAAVNQEGTDALDSQIADVMQYLARHGVPIGKQIATVAREAEGDLLLALARQLDIDLIVAGAYGRTRLTEWIFGGVTRHLLRASPVSCLFSN